MSEPRRQLIFFAKTPELGRVKTRLQPTVSAEGALALHRALVRDTLLLLGRSGRADLVTVAFSGEPERDLVPSGIAVERQAGAGLGERLTHSVLAAYDRGAHSVVVLGTDSPDLPPEWIDLAFERLSDFDVVLGPALDGGYYLIGLAGPHVGIFEGIPWSTDQVLVETRRRIEGLGLSYAELDPWSDVDRPADLERRAAEIGRRRGLGTPFPRHTALVLEQLGWL